jgi:YfiR/HmsC-like
VFDFQEMTIQPQIRRDSTLQAIARKACVALSVLLTICSVGDAQAPSEYQVKAAFLLNFIKFVGWPASSFESPTSPFSICVLGDDPFGRDLDQVVEGETISGRRVEVVRLQRGPIPKSCQVLFVSKSEKDPGILSGVGPGVLTVSDRDRFLMEGGMIAFVIEDRHVRFDINQRAASKGSLTMNARMLNVARSVQK